MESDPTICRPLSTTVTLALAALASALVAIFGDKEALTVATIVFALIGLIPWALDAGGVELSPAIFAVMTVVPAAAIVVIARNPGGTFPMMLAIVALSRGGDRRVTLAAITSGTAAIVTLAILKGTAHETGAVFFIAGLGVAWLAGTMVRRQEMLIAELRAAHALHSEDVAAQERTRIAREIHDVVAHSLTVTMLHVTGARRAMNHDPARAAEALERAEQVGRDSLDSIRQIVGLLRSADGDRSDEAPMPSLTDLPALVERYRDAGLVVRSTVDVDAGAADPTAALVAFRVVQEALSNVLQHAPGAPLELSVIDDPIGMVLKIVAENPVPQPSSSTRTGLGVRGMIERVRTAGGTIEVGMTERGCWRVEAVLPIRRLTAIG